MSDKHANEFSAANFGTVLESAEVCLRHNGQYIISEHGAGPVVLAALKIAASAPGAATAILTEAALSYANGSEEGDATRATILTAVADILKGIPGALSVFQAVTTHER